MRRRVTRSEPRSPGWPRPRGSRVRPPRADLRIPSDRRDQRREQGGTGHDGVDLEVLPGGVVDPADGTQAVDRRHAHPGRGVGVGGTTGRRVLSSKPSPPATATAWSTSRPERSSFSIGQWRGSCAATVAVRPGTVGRPQRLPDGRLRRRRGRRGAPRARPPAASSRPRPRSDASRRSNPHVDGDPRPAPVERMELPPSGAASRIALRPFSGSTPACAARPLTVIARSEVALARRHDVAVRARALEHEAASASAAQARGCAVSMTGEPISSSGLATKTRRPSGTTAERVPERAMRVQAASSPLFMSVTPGPGAMPPAIANGRRAAVPGRTRCPCGRCTGASGPPGPVPRIAAPPCRPGRLVVVPRHRRAQGPASARPVQAPMASTPALV